MLYFKVTTIKVKLSIVKYRLSWNLWVKNRSSRFYLIVIYFYSNLFLLKTAEKIWIIWWIKPLVLNYIHIYLNLSAHFSNQISGQMLPAIRLATVGHWNLKFTLIEDTSSI